jgi:hypothetical protein
MNLKKLLSIGLTLMILTTLVVTGNEVVYAATEKECSLKEAYENFGVFTASVLAYDDMAEYWKDIQKSLAHRHAHYNAIDNALNKLSKIRASIRSAYIGCNQTLVTRLKDRYYILQLELHYIRNYDKTNILALMKAKSKQNIFLKGEFNDKNVEDLYRNFEATYKGHHARWSNAGDTDEIRELKAAWQRLRETFGAGDNETKQTKEEQKKTEPGVHQSTAGKVGEYFLERLELRIGGVSPPLTINDIITGEIEDKYERGKQEVARELNKDFDVRSETGKELEVEDLKTLPEDVAEIREEAEQAAQKQNKSIVGIWDNFQNASTNFERRFAKAEIMSRYDTLFRGGGDQATQSLVNILNKTKDSIHSSLLPLADITTCAEATQSRQCSK